MSLTITIAVWRALKAVQGTLVLMSGNSALFPMAPYAVVGTINAAIGALAKVFSDPGIADSIQVNSVLPGRSRAADAGRISSTGRPCTT